MGTQPVRLLRRTRPDVRLPDLRQAVAVMTDATTRAKERTGGGIMERLRADEIPAYTVARDVACEDCDGSGFVQRNGQCGLCGGTGRDPYEPLDLLRLLAFLGVEEAREVEPGAYGLCGCHESVGECEHLEGVEDETPLLCYWLQALSRLLVKLPPHRLLVNSTRPLVYALDRRATSGLVETKTNWPHDTPAERWLMVVAALAVAWALARVRATRRLVTLPALLLAGQAWVEEPTPERERAWHAEWSAGPLPEWVLPLPTTQHAREALQAAASIIGAARVREIVTAALLGRLLDDNQTGAERQGREA